jgi:hypothetical protein
MHLCSVACEPHCPVTSPFTKALYCYSSALIGCHACHIFQHRVLCVSTQSIVLCLVLYVPTWHIPQYSVLYISNRRIFLCSVLCASTWHVSQYSVLYVSMFYIFHCSVPCESTRQVFRLWILHISSQYSLVYSSPLCCKYIILDWVTVKTQLFVL